MLTSQTKHLIFLHPPCHVILGCRLPFVVVHIRLYVRENGRHKVCVSGLMENEVHDLKALVRVSVTFYRGLYKLLYKPVPT